MKRLSPPAFPGWLTWAAYCLPLGTIGLACFTTAIFATPLGHSDDRHCADQPSLCGFPDATNTGYGDATTLRRVPEEVSSGPGWHWDPRGWVEIDEEGAVFEGFSVAATVSVTADNVTVRRVRITVGGETFGVAIRHANNVTVADSTIGPPDQSPRLMVGIKDIYGDATGTILERNNIFSAATGIQITSGLIQHNFIHDLKEIEGDHVNGITSNGSRSPLVVRHNTIFNQISQTDAIGLFPDFGTEANRTIDGNLLAGGGYTIYAGQKNGAPAPFNIKITNNRFSRVFFPNSGFFGHITGYDAAASSWSNNIWDDTLGPATIP